MNIPLLRRKSARNKNPTSGSPSKAYRPRVSVRLRFFMLCGQSESGTVPFLSIKTLYNVFMARMARVDIGGHVYHVLNRAVGRFQIFDHPEDYRCFLDLLLDAKELTDMRILSFTVMPNHWHLQLFPKRDGDLRTFMHWLTNTHTRRVHAFTESTGTGPLYQGRYKSFLIQKDEHLLAVLKYIERNPVRARLAKRPEDWLWGSAYVRRSGTDKMKKILSESPVPLPRNYLQWINEREDESGIDEIRTALRRGAPFGRSKWIDQMVDQNHLQSTVRSRGRPRS